MSYQYKKSTILYELEQAIKRKVIEKPKSKYYCQKNMQPSFEKRKNQRESLERLSKPRELSKKVENKAEKAISLFNTHKFGSTGMS